MTERGKMRIWSQYLCFKRNNLARLLKKVKKKISQASGFYLPALSPAANGLSPAGSPVTNRGE
jgi:hypothetical protein